uniref:Uncharacterized protein n=1 Tax=Cacopsylla melanoneura TaxID=428564 RepID=A0A8D8VSD7_9HEMI
MTLSRNQVLHLKRNMDVEYLKHFNLDVQTSAYEIYHELHSLKELNQIELPETLLSKISEVLNTFNEEIQKNNDLKTKSQNLTELLQKEVQQKTFFEGKFNQERDNNAVISNQADTDEKKFKDQETQYKTEIIRLKQTGLKWKVENDDMKTEKERLVAENENLKKKIKKLEENMNRKEDPDETTNKPSEKKKTVMTLHEEILNPNTTTHNTSVKLNNDSSSDDISIIPTPAQLRTPAPPNTSILNQTAQNNTNTFNPSIHDNLSSNLKNRLFVLGDSHCRYLEADLKKYANPECRINCVAMPGRKLHQIVSALKPDKLTPDTNICIIAGTNDVFQSTYDSMIKSYDLLFNKCKNFKVFVVLIPPRYDVRRISSHIVNLNCKIKHYLTKYPNFTCVDPNNFLNIYSYSDDCVHLNRKGISMLCKSIIGKIYNKIHYNVDNRTRDSGTHTSTMHYNRVVPQHTYQYTAYTRNQIRRKHTQQPQHTFSRQNVAKHHTLEADAPLPPALMRTPIPPPLSMYPPLRHHSIIQNQSQQTPIQPHHTYSAHRKPPPTYRDTLIQRNFPCPLTTLV